MPPLQELFVSQIYGFTVYIKTASSHTRFGNNSAKITHFIRIYTQIVLKLEMSFLNSSEFDPSIISSNVASRRGIIYAVSDRITAVNPAISTSGYYTTPGTWTSVSISLSRVMKTCTLLKNNRCNNEIFVLYP